MRSTLARAGLRPHPVDITIVVALTFVVMDRKAALAPLDFIVSTLGACLLVICLLMGWNALFGAEAPAGATEYACVTGHVRTGDDSLFGTRPTILDLEPGVTTNARDLELCDSSPTTGQLWLERAMINTPDLLYAVLTLVLLWRLVRRARRSGFFVPEIALGVGRLGLFILLWGLVVTALQAWAAAELVSSMAPHGTVDGAWQYLGRILTPLLIGFGLLTVSRVLAQAVPMQHELDTTV